jgi:hypothetical protein
MNSDGYHMNTGLIHKGFHCLQKGEKKIIKHHRGSVLAAVRTMTLAVGLNPRVGPQMEFCRVSGN